MNTKGISAPAVIITLVLLAAIAGGIWWELRSPAFAEEPFVRDYSLDNLGGPASEGYRGRVIVEGEYYQGEPNNTHGGSITCFYPDMDTAAKLPRTMNGERIERFCFDNHGLDAAAAFHISTEAFNDPSICSVRGGATIVLSTYHVLTAEIGGSDMASLEQVISASAPQAVKCQTQTQIQTQAEPVLLEAADDHRRVQDISTLSVAVQAYLEENNRFPSTASWKQELSSYLPAYLRDNLNYDYATCRGAVAVLRTRLETPVANQYLENDMDETECGLSCTDPYYCTKVLISY
jgi:hypothetical protein